MCGICGLIGQASRERLVAMNALLAHRGPDDEGTAWFERPDAPPVGLGHRRLSIIGLETGHQPMHNADGTHCLVYNGEIYNFREIRAALEADGFVFRTDCDTETILLGYAAWGDAVVDRLEGMFAFALWDALRGRMLLARDRFGIKPLYYRHEKDLFAFASEIKPLLEFGRPDVNLEALYHYLLYSWPHRKQTIFDHICQLEPGTRMVVDGAALQVARYWQMPDQVPGCSDAEWPGRIRHLLRDSVDRHLVADVPVGLTLSGGLDSSAVLACMVDCAGTDRVRAFTHGFRLPNDETPYAEDLAAHFDASLSVHREDPEAIRSVFSQMLWHLEEPLAHPVAPTTWFLAQFVREHLKVVLIGEGSDELFAGYPHYRLADLPYSFLPRAWKRGLFLAGIHCMPTAKTWAKLLTPEWLDRELLEHVAHRYDDYFCPDPIRGSLRYELDHELVNNQLLRIDKLMMAHSVEARVPFLDRAFAEAASSVPFRLKRAGGVEKHVLREAMARDLPQKILHRPKSGPGGTQALLPILEGRILAGTMREHLCQQTLQGRGWFRPEAVESYLGARKTLCVRRHPIESRRRAKSAYALAVLEEWARLYLDRDAPTAPPEDA
jgi:asparagine synthase (glutamine-hydrolysing)